MEPENIQRRTKLKTYWEKIKDIKNIKIIVVLLVVAVIFTIYGVISNRIATQKQTSVTTTVKQEKSESTVEYSEKEKKLADILSYIDGIGETKVMISGEADKYTGVIVVAQGADKPLVEWRIRHAVQTALKIDYNSIEVYSMN